jgi:hypothetical protein
VRTLRNVLVVLALLVAIAALVYFWKRPQIAGIPTIPLDLVRLMPTTWTVLPKSSFQCDFDLDPSADLDWLVVYRYDSGMIGGVVFATQVNRVPQAPGNQSPYRPAFIVPYKLLPDIYENKGQGYLGDKEVQVRLANAATVNAAGCQTREFTVFGSNGANYNRISIFRWNADASRFDGKHFTGSARVDPPPGPANTPQTITSVITYDTFNDRSALCAKHYWQRNGGPQPPPATLDFTEDTASYTIDFCFATPDDPAHPEGVVVALLRNPTLPPANNPIGNGYFLDSDARSAIPDDLAPLKTQGGWSPYRIITVRHKGTIADVPEQGEVIGNPQATGGGGRWWRNNPNELAVEYATLVLPDGREEDFTFYLASVADEQVVTDVRWRVVRVTQP